MSEKQANTIIGLLIFLVIILLMPIARLPDYKDEIVEAIKESSCK